jgi:hypothetical protein
MFSLFGCFKKKNTNPRNLEEWLDANFPGQFKVLDSNQNYDIKDLFFTGKKRGVVADAADQDVQFTLDWIKPDKNNGSLDLRVEEVKAKLEEGRADVKRGRELFKLLKDNGLQQFSVSSIEQAAYILVFAEPTIENRRQIITVIKNTLDARAEQPQTSIWIEIMEPSAYQVEFQDIIPRSLWLRPGTWHDSNKIMSLDFEWKKGISIDALMKGWAFNTHSDRTSQFRIEAYPKALAWAEKKLPKPFYLEPEHMVWSAAVESDEAAEAAVKFGFPYYASKPGDDEEVEPKGHVAGIYLIDKKEFINIKKDY